MEIEFQTSRKEYTNFYFSKFKMKFLRNSIIILIVSFFLALNIFSLQTESLNFFLFAGISSLILLTIFHILPKWILIYKLHKRINKLENIYDNKKLTLSEEGITIISQNNSSLINFNDIRYIYLKHAFVNLGFVGERNLLIPVKIFSKKEEMDEFVKIIKSKIKKTFY